MATIRRVARGVWRAALYLVLTVAIYIVVRRLLLGAGVPLGDEASLLHFERTALAVVSAALAKSFFT